MKKLSNILIIDDDPLTGPLHKKTIEGFNVADTIEVVNNGKDAIDLISHRIQTNSLAKLPQLIFVDLYMPFMDGFEFLEAYNKLSFNYKDSIVVAVLTTSFFKQDKERVKKYNIDYIEKPITHEKILQLMDSLNCK